MLKNYILIAFRNLTKHKGFSALNITGLAIGMTVFMLIVQYVQFERSYEAFLPESENIYRVALERYDNGELIIASAENVPAVGPALKAELPEVEDFARMYNMGYKNNVIITNEAVQPTPIAFKHRLFMYADASFLTLMGYEMALGDAATALAQPNQAVISEAYAEKYFGANWRQDNPIGQSLRMQDDDYNDETVQVMGIFKDLPANTHLKFDVLFSYETLYTRWDRAKERYHTSWGRNDMYTFIKVKPGTNPEQLAAKFPAIVTKNNPDLAQNNRADKLTLQAISDIHLTSDLAEEPEPNGNERIVFFLSIIGLLVLVIAWINYVNLATARAMERAREVGIRKVSGAVKGQLISQFLIESGLVNFLSVLLAIGFTGLSLGFFNQLTGLQISLANLVQPWSLGLLAGIWAVGTFLSGLYPAWVLSAFQPVKVLKGQFKNTSSGIWLRKGLVVVQFAASIALIASTFIIYRQLNHMLNQDIGMNIDQVLVVERPGISPRDRQARNSAIDVFRAEMAKKPEIKGLSSSVTIPGKQREYKTTARRYGTPEETSKTIRFNSMDYSFVEVFEMDILAGRAFSKDFPSDQDTSCIITESAVRILGFDSPEEAIGKTIAIPNFRWNPIIVGVVNDYNQVSLKKAVEPILFYCTSYSGEFYSMRVSTNNLDQTIAHARRSWETAFPGNPFDFFFLNDYFNNQYQNEKRFSRLALVFALLAVLVGCLGLFGLSGYTITQRTKEIGVRKILGATTSSIVAMLSKDILKLVLVSILIAAPLAWWAMDNWLQDFAYRTNIEWWIFGISGLIAVLVAFLTVSFQSVKAALANPIGALKSE